MYEFDRTALVLAGGGLTGAVYEIGALRAIEDMLVDRSVLDFDIFVGTSAGSLVASMLVNRISPEEMLSVIDGTHPDIHTLDRSYIFGIDQKEWLRWLSRLPRKVISAWGEYIFNLGEMTFFDFLWKLSEALPAGIYDSLALERFVNSVLCSRDSCSNNFDDLEKELYIIATDLEDGERVVFGKLDGVQVPISLAVAASSALPILYKPVRINGREYVDGGLRGNASLDLAIEKGATLVVCINPMVPLNNRLVSDTNKEVNFLSEKGIRLVADQTLRITSHSGLQYHVKQLRRRHPEVDIILIEPQADDSAIFYENIMQYSARMTIARHGFESVTLELAEEYPRIKEILNRHNIPISRRLVIEELAEISQSNYDPVVIRKILEARTPGCSMGKMDSPLCQLSKTLSQLEFNLEKRETMLKGSIRARAE
jgi:predicted acylesterase/phospholipase RssA